MNVFNYACIAVTYLLCVRGSDFLICRSSADEFDANIVSNNCKDTTARLKALEGQVRQLRSLVEDGTFFDRRARYQGIPADCGEIFANGTSTSGVYIISPDGRCPFSVYCDMADDGWTVIQRRIDGAVSFYRTWDEYVQGFGDIDGEYWLGLEKMHRLTRQGYEIYFDIENYDGTRDHAHYKTFTVHGVTTLYKMHVDAVGYTGTLEELFSYHDNKKFSTFDRDNDESPTGNCATILDGGGWWYGNCYKLGNPNGIYGKRGQGGVGYFSTGHITVRNFIIKVRNRQGVC